VTISRDLMPSPNAERRPNALWSFPCMCVGTTAAVISPFSSTPTRLRILLLQRRMEGGAIHNGGSGEARRTSLFRGSVIKRATGAMQIIIRARESGNHRTMLSSGRAHLPVKTHSLFMTLKTNFVSTSLHLRPRASCVHRDIWKKGPAALPPTCGAWSERFVRIKGRGGVNGLRMVRERHRSDGRFVVA
jgi:hypothetical protein